jgi:hypothetical protein
VTWIRWRLRLAGLRHNERRLVWQLDLWPDPDLEQVLAYVKYARQQAELGRPTYPHPQDGSR